MGRSVDNIISLLEHCDRVDKIELLGVDSSQLGDILAAMQEPFPGLTDLHLHSFQVDETVQVIPNSFLGGCASRLQFLWLDGIPFPGLPKLLLSTTQLVHLFLENTPHSGYISPEEMTSSLATLINLGSLGLEFQSPLSRPHWASRPPPPPTRSVLPALTNFCFKGASEYLDDLVAHIDSPKLNNLNITFFNDIVFDTPQFIQFINRTPTFKQLEKAQAFFATGAGNIKFSSQTPGYYGKINVEIRCRALDWQVSSLEQVCTSCLPPLSMLENLYIDEDPYLPSDWGDNIETTQWLEILRPFTSAKNLYLSERFTRRIVPALQGLNGGETTEVLPNVRNIFLKELQPFGPVWEGIRQFVSARQVAHRPILVPLAHW